MRYTLHLNLDTHYVLWPMDYNGVYKVKLLKAEQTVTIAYSHSVLSLWIFIYIFNICRNLQRLKTAS